MNISWKKMLVAAVLTAIGALNCASASAGDKGRARLGGSGQGAQHQLKQRISGQGTFGNNGSGKSIGRTVTLPSNTLGNGSGGTNKGRTTTLPFQSIGQKTPILAGTPILANPLIILAIAGSIGVLNTTAAFRLLQKDIQTLTGLIRRADGSVR